MNDTLVRRFAMTGVVVSATVLSYSTLHHRALAINIPEWSAWFYPVLYDAFILGASRMWQNQELSVSTRKLAKCATLGGIIAAIVAFIVEFAPFGALAVLGALMIPAVMATALVLTSRAAADRKERSVLPTETAQDEHEDAPTVVVPDPAPEPVAAKLEGSTLVVEDAALSEPENGRRYNMKTITFDAMPDPANITGIAVYDVTDKNEWINAQLDAGVELTGAMIDKKFGGRNGARTLKKALEKRSSRNGHRAEVTA